MTSDPPTQITRDVLLVRPRCFRPNADTAASNRFQQSTELPAEDIARRAIAEFDGLVAGLEAAGVRPVVAEDTAEPAKPDAVFPNNWVSFHEDATVVLYPMEAPSRRPERRTDIVELVASRAGFSVSRIVDLSPLERRGQYLEGTGSLILDRPERVAYAALSSRTHPDAVARFAAELGFETVCFNTRDETGMPLYHTNVMLSIGATLVVVCAEVIADPRQRRTVLERLRASGREVLEISPAQMRGFAANVLELSTGGRPVVAMSDTARRAFGVGELDRIGARADIMAVPVPTIEQVGGGSVRCMLAEIFRRVCT